MTFLARGKTYTIPFTPPLASYRDARARVVEMDKEALVALNRSDITVKEFLPPTGLYFLEFCVITATFLAYSQRWWFARGGVVERVLGAGFARFSWGIQPWLLGALVVIHGCELAVFVPKYLRRHSVEFGSRVFWLWVGFSFVEGQFAWWRFQALVERKRVEAERRKH